MAEEVLKSDAYPAKSNPTRPEYAQFNAGPIVFNTDIPGLKYDFNYGARVQLPETEEKYLIRITDIDSNTVLFNEELSNVTLTSTKKYYVNFKLEVFKNGNTVFSHSMDLAGKKVLIKFPVGTLGDIIAWFPYAEKFRRKHKCNLYVSMADYLMPLFTDKYKDIHFIKDGTAPDNCYATYYMGIFFPADDRNHQPVDFRIAGLHKTISYILGLPPEELHTQVSYSQDRIIKEPYVCIAAQATSQAKYWNNPEGWILLVEQLKRLGYRVLCIDKERIHGTGDIMHYIPYGSEDFTGDIPLKERANLLGHADFFIGLSSGLAWLAWACNCPVIMISGFTLPLNEFYTPYRVINYNVCNGCWNDSTEEFCHTNFMWCPRHEGTNRAYECTKFISAGQVLNHVNKLMKDYDLSPKDGKTRCDT